MTLWRIILLLIAALALIGIAGAIHAASGATFPSKYDHDIKSASERWLPGVPWRLLKAQLYQESKLDPTARSPVGAEGIGQFMPATWTEVSAALGYHGVGRGEAGPMVNAAAYYMARMKRLYPAISEFDKHRLGAASYNAGGGNVLKAMRGCGGTDTWEGAAKCLPTITGHHSVETVVYVQRIWTWWAMMEAGA